MLFPTGDGSERVWVSSSEGTILEFNSTDGISYVGDTDVVASLVRLADGWLFKDSGDRTEEFDNSGKLVSVTTKDGMSHQYSYIGTSLIITDDYGRALSVEYELDGLPAGVTLPDGSSIDYDLSLIHI